MKYLLTLFLLTTSWSLSIQQGNDPCLSNPCNSQQICVTNTYVYECVCITAECLDNNFGLSTTTQFVPTISNPCSQNPCSADFLCLPTSTGHQCLCVRESCFQPISTTTTQTPNTQCESNPCNEDYLCVPYNQGHFCVCVKMSCYTTVIPPVTTTTLRPITRTTTQPPIITTTTQSTTTVSLAPTTTAFNPCFSNPCQPGFSCILNINGYQCICLDQGCQPTITTTQATTSTTIATTSTTTSSPSLPCDSNPCSVGFICVTVSPVQYQCICVVPACLNQSTTTSN